MNCENCFYSHKGKSKVFTTEIFCHRYPPIMMIWPTESGAFSFTIDYPPIESTGIVCGEFKEKEYVSDRGSENEEAT